MKNQETLKTFNLDIESVGSFNFAYRTMRDELRIGAEYSRLTEGVEQPSKWLDLLATMLATLKVLTVEAPDEWNLDELDPLEPDSYQRLTSVFNALREKEKFFRNGPGSTSQGDREETSGNTSLVDTASV